MADTSKCAPIDICHSCTSTLSVRYFALHFLHFCCILLLRLWKIKMHLLKGYYVLGEYVTRASVGHWCRSIIGNSVKDKFKKIALFI